MFQVIEDQHVSKNNVSSAAFCKARKKISHSAFKAINASLTDSFYGLGYFKRWNGFRLLAVDASITILPTTTALFEYFERSRHFAGHPAARISQLYDIENKISVDVQVAPNKLGERDLAAKHLEVAKPGDLILYDRGYPATWLFNLHKQKNIDFVVRATVDSTSIIRDFLKWGEMEAFYKFPCIDRSLEVCLEKGYPTTPTDLRLIRADLPSGEITLDTIKSFYLTSP